MSMRTIGLIVSAGFAMVAAAGCSHAASTSGTAAPSASPVVLSSAWAGGPNAGSNVPAAQVAPGAWAPLPTPTGGFLKTTTPSLPASATAATTAVCGPALGSAPSIPVGATAGTAAATVSWQDLADVNVLRYRIGAVPEGVSKGPGTTGKLVQSVAQWQTVAAGHTCTTLTFTFNGLPSGTAYQFWVDAVHTTTAYGVPSVTTETMIGRSAAIVVR